MGQTVNPAPGIGDAPDQNSRTHRNGRFEMRTAPAPPLAQRQGARRGLASGPSPAG